MNIVHTYIQTLVALVPHYKSILIYPMDIQTLDVLVPHCKSILIYPYKYTNIRCLSAILQIYTNISIQKYKH